MFGSSRLFMLMAMAGLMGGNMGGVSSPRRSSSKRSLSPQDEAKVLEKNKAKFLSDLERQNAERKLKFPKFKEHEVFGLKIIAFSPKNAERDIKLLFLQNNLSIEIKETVEQ